MKSGTTLTGISGTFSALGLSVNICGVSWPGGVGVNGFWANRVTPADSASAPATPLIQSVFISYLDNGAKCNTTSRSRPPHFRSGFQQQMSAGRAGVLVSDAALSQIAATALAGLHGPGRLHACFGRRRAPFQDFCQTVSSLQGTPHRVHRR